MAIEGDEAKCSHSYLHFNTSRDNGSEKHRAEGNANNDDGGGESFRLRIELFLFPFNTSQRDETMIIIEAEKREESSDTWLL